MDAERLGDAFVLLSAFLREDEFYLASSAAYGDEGVTGLRNALEMFLQRPGLGFVWLAYADEQPAGVCVVCYAISTSIGGVVAKLDDVFVTAPHRAHGVGTAMIRALASELRDQGVRRIDTSLHIENRRGAGFYEKLGFKSLGEERLALVL
jgi:GNAT superfamily N-acetyltransferase